jgi:hypothetical protein
MHEGAFLGLIITGTVPGAVTPGGGCGARGCDARRRRYSWCSLHNTEEAHGNGEPQGYMAASVVLVTKDHRRQANNTRVYGSLFAYDGCSKQG